MLTRLRTRLSRQDGVTAIEYALIAALIALVIIGVVTAVGQGLIPAFESVDASLP